jgi:hypothetical protein
MQDNDGAALREATPCFLSPAGSDTPEADFLSLFLLASFPAFRGSG